MNSGYGLLGAFVFLVAGVILQALLQQFVYPRLSEYHERAKAAGRQTMAPSRIVLVMRLVNFVLLPAVGLLAGEAIFKR